MIEEVAVVTKVTGKLVQIQGEIKSTCHACEQSSQCASGQVAKALPHKKLTIELNNNLNLALGDKVIIGLPQEQLLSAAVYTYIWPLIGLIAGAVLAQWLSFPHELYQVCFAFIGAYTGFSLAKIKQSQLSKRQAGWLQPEILRKACTTIPVKQVN